MFNNNSTPPRILSRKNWKPRAVMKLLCTRLFYSGEKKYKYISIVNGAEFFGDKVDRRFEKYDYDSLTDLGETFVKTLEDYLFYPERYTPNRTIFRIFGDFLRSVFKNRT